ncbi:hypothetical protein E4185_16895 [Aeromonas media]|uniref:phage tail fiber protein n=1 Tax=Aeromonas media TaxID=651 RepID=UPI00148B0D75|nr:hypothetical protein [Aeromonas media]QJT27577.1 hypothetical protein E4185_16895 [Aeromonas media]
MTKEKILDVIKSSKTIDSVYDIKLNKGQGTNAASATRKDYVDGQDALKVNKAGDTMTGSLTTTANLYADGTILAKSQVIAQDVTNTYSTRMVVAGTVGYFQAGKVDRDVADQKLILSGWQGTPLTMSRFAMVNGVNPQVLWGSTTYDILHRGNMPTVTDLNAVSKSGDTIEHLTINPNGYFKQNYAGLVEGYKISKKIGYITDTKAGLIVLGEIKTTNQQPEGFSGTISIQRGGIGSANITNVINLVVKKAYNAIEARIISTTPPRSGGRLCKITHEGKDYIAYYSHVTSDRQIVVDGISWGIEPFVIPDATGYVLSDLISSTDTIRTDINDFMLNNNNNERVPSWGVSEGQGFVMHGKTAIGGANDGWLRLNPFDAFSTGIYTGNGIIRHGGTSIQLGSLGDAQATTLYRPNDAAWSLTTGGYAAVSVKQQTSSSAHWLLGSYKSSFEGDMRAGIQVLSNDTGTMRIYTNMRTHYAEIRDGNVLVSGVQSSAVSSLTRKDYVDGQDALKVNKTGDTMTGQLTISQASANPGLILERTNLAYNVSMLFKTTTLSNYLGMDRNGKLRYGSAVDVDATGAFVYTSDNKPTSADVGAVNKAGDTMTGNLTAPAVLVSSAQNTSINALTRKDYVDAAIDTKASNRVNFASQLGINRSITGATVPTHVGVWAVNNSTWTPVGYGSLYVTTNRADELTTTGQGSFIHYLFISHNNARIYSATNVNGSFSGWRLTDADSVNKSGDTMTGNLTAPKVLVSGAQGAEGNALTRKDYVDTELSRKLSLTGGKVTGPITSLVDDNFRIASGSIGTFWRKDDSRLYLMLTAAGDPEGTYNNLRPFHVSLTDGSVVTETKLLLPAGQAQQADAATRKDYVDGQVATRAPTTHTHTVSAITDLNAQNATATANTLALRDSEADVHARLLRTTYGDEFTMSGALAFRVNNSTNNYTRYCNDPTSVRNWMRSAKTSWDMNWRAYIEDPSAPMTEYHIPGKAAVITYLATDNGYRITSSDGVGGGGFERLRLDSSGNLFTTGAIHEAGQRVYSPNNPPPNTNSHNHTAAQANSNVVAGEYYAVGSYILAQKLTSSANGYGDNILGSSLIPASAGNRYWDGHPIPGTWKCMGYAADTGQEVDQRTTLFIRIS